MFELINQNERKAMEIHDLNLILHSKITKINEIKKTIGEYYETSVTDEEVVESIKQLVAKIKLISAERVKDFTVLA